MRPAAAFFVPAAFACPNVYGYSDGVRSVNSNRGILNAMMQRATQGEALTLYGDGAYVRDFSLRRATSWTRSAVP
jgi:nucleoside-diphosphate-sugar epimerase